MEAVLRQFFERRLDGLVAVYLFGSRARKTHGAASDVDVAVLLDRDPPPTLAGMRFDWAADLALEIGHEVDFIVLNRASPDLIHRVLRDGKLIVDRDPSARIRFEVQARSKYFDLLPILNEYRKSRARAR
jgi:hypothetical protein